MLSRLLVRPSFAGRGLLERTRSTGFALLGVTAALGLGLVALLAQPSWPYLPASPIPVYGTDGGSLDGAIDLAPPPLEAGTTPGRRPARVGSADRGGAAAEPAGSHLSKSRQVSLAGAPGADDGQPAGEGAPSPAPVPVLAPAPEPAPAAPAQSASPAASGPASPSTPASPAGSPPAPDTQAVASGAPGRGNAYGRQKAAAVPSKAKSSHAAPHSSSAPPGSGAEPVPAANPEPPAPPAAAASDKPGNGRGKAYGHDK